MKYPLHADDFVIDDPAEGIIYKHRPKFSLVMDLIWYSLGPPRLWLFDWHPRYCDNPREKSCL